MSAVRCPLSAGGRARRAAPEAGGGGVEHSARSALPRRAPCSVAPMAPVATVATVATVVAVATSMRRRRLCGPAAGQRGALTDAQMKAVAATGGVIGARPAHGLSSAGAAATAMGIDGPGLAELSPPPNLLPQGLSSPTLKPTRRHSPPASVSASASAAAAGVTLAPAAHCGAGFDDVIAGILHVVRYPAISCDILDRISCGTGFGNCLGESASAGRPHTRRLGPHATWSRWLTAAGAAGC